MILEKNWHEYEIVAYKISFNFQSFLGRSLLQILLLVFRQTTMRWSQPSLFFIFAVLILGEVAISAPIYVDSDIVLEARSPVRTTPVKTRSSTRAQRPATPPPRPPPRPRTPPPRPATSMGRPASPVRAADFKKSSATYRKAALEGDTYHRTSGGLVKSKTGPSLGPGKQAGERLKTPKLLCIVYWEICN